MAPRHDLLARAGSPRGALRTRSRPPAAPATFVALPPVPQLAAVANPPADLDHPRRRPLPPMRLAQAAHRPSPHLRATRPRTLRGHHRPLLAVPPTSRSTAPATSTTMSNRPPTRETPEPLVPHDGLSRVVLGEQAPWSLACLGRCQAEDGPGECSSCQTICLPQRLR